MSYLVGATAAFALAALAFQARGLLRVRVRPDLARPRGREALGVAYAYTWGMMPWAKESTRQHLFAYARGVAFHLGVFAALAALPLVPLSARLPLWSLSLSKGLLGLGSLAGVLGLILRVADDNLRAISHPDDYLSLVLADGLLILALAAWCWPSWLPRFYLEAALLFLYLPFSKIRHTLYFFFARYYFGKLFGRRGIIPLPVGEGR